MKAGLWPQKTGQYDFQEDETGKGLGPKILNKMVEIDHKLHGDGVPFWINFNRVYNFQAGGNYR